MRCDTRGQHMHQYFRIYIGIRGVGLGRHSFSAVRSLSTLVATIPGFGKRYYRSMLVYRRPAVPNPSRTQNRYRLEDAVLSLSCRVVAKSGRRFLDQVSSTRPNTASGAQHMANVRGTGGM